MKRWLVCGVLVAPMVFVGELSAQESDHADPFDGQYGVVVENNIFVRNRGQHPGASVTPPTTQPSTAPTTPERSLMLTGIVFEDGVYRAYFESLSGGSPLRVVPGDPIARGTVADIALNAVAYLGADGDLQWVEVGQDLTGVTAVASSRARVGPSGTPSDSTAATAPVTETDPSTLSVRERMMRQRQEALRRN